MCQRFTSHIQSNYHCQARNWVQSGVCSGQLPIGTIWFSSCLVHTSDVDLSMFWFPGYAIERNESGVLTEINARHSIVLSSFDACSKIQLLCHLLSPLHFPLQLPAYKPFSWLEHGYRWDQAAEGLISKIKFHQAGMALSEPLETTRWRITQRPVPIPRIMWHISLQSQFHRFFSLCRTPSLIEHSGNVANCDHRLELHHWVRGCMGIAMRRTSLRKSLLAILLPARKMQFTPF